MTPEQRAEIANRLAGLGVSGPATDRRDIADLLAALDEREQQIAAVRALPTFHAAFPRGVGPNGQDYEGVLCVDALDLRAVLDAAPKEVGDA